MLTEFDYFITPDNIVHDLHDLRVRVILTASGYGMPPLEWQTKRGPYQHGETAIGYRLRPRIVQLIVRWMAFSREEYWSKRTQILDIFRPNRSDDASPAVLRKVLPSGEMRDLHVQVSQGPIFKARDPTKWEEHSFEELVRLVAHDPVWFDPEKHIEAIVDTEDELVFPIEPFVLFGPMDALYRLFNLTTLGSWRTWPTIECIGPLTTVLVHNLTIGEKIQFEHEILGDQIVTIDLTPGRKTVIDNYGNNLLAYITADSDLATFRFEIDPLAAGGVNEIEVIAGYVEAGRGAVNLYWFDRYIGI